ncbi:polcalcin Ole e 3-like [Tasmannia lanceolata]|uniref:polcalcin Ole e 3-like n=1 Tax=Tasmannia lanceolata TaxID=3420 RepID=UPI004062D147
MPPSLHLKNTKTNKNMANTTDLAEAERIFKHFDANGDGKISSSELGDYNALGSLGSVSPDKIQRMIDTDGDGYIDFKEFTAFHRTNGGIMKDISKYF